MEVQSALISIFKNILKIINFNQQFYVVVNLFEFSPVYRILIGILWHVDFMF